jgi:hypothetical protein
MDYTSRTFEVTNLFCDVPGLLDSFYNPCTVSEDSSVSFPIIALSLCGNWVDCEGLFQSPYRFLRCDSDSLLEVMELIKQTAMDSTSGVMFRKGKYQISTKWLYLVEHNTWNIYLFTEVQWATCFDPYRVIIRPAGVYVLVREKNTCVMGSRSVDIRVYWPSINLYQLWAICNI